MVQLSMIKIRRLTCMVMLIQIGSATEEKNTLGCFFSFRSSMGYWFGRMESCMALSTAKRGAVNLQFVIQIEISRKREF